MIRVTVLEVMVTEQQRLTALDEVLEARRLLDSAASRFEKCGHKLNATQLRTIASQLRISEGPRR